MAVGGRGDVQASLSETAIRPGPGYPISRGGATASSALSRTGPVSATKVNAVVFTGVKQLRGPVAQSVRALP